MSKIEYYNQNTGSLQQAKGSDGRLNTSARADGRAYYNSRDREQCYTLVFDHQGAVAGEFSAYFKNTSPDLMFVVSSVGINCAQNARIKLHWVAGTVTGGAVITPANLKVSSPKKAAATACQGLSGDSILGIASNATLDFAAVLANGHEEMRLSDRIRLGQDEAIALEYDEGTTGDFFGVIFGYFE